MLFSLALCLFSRGSFPSFPVLSRRVGHLLHAPLLWGLLPAWVFTSSNIAAKNASSSSGESNSAACPETTCSTRPEQPSGACSAVARNCTTKARLLGRVG